MLILSPDLDNEIKTRFAEAVRLTVESESLPTGSTNPRTMEWLLKGWKKERYNQLKPILFKEELNQCHDTL